MIGSQRHQDQSERIHSALWGTPVRDKKYFRYDTKKRWPGGTSGFPSSLHVEQVGYSVWIGNVRFNSRGNRLFGVEMLVAGNLVFEQEGRTYPLEEGMLFLRHRDKPSRYHVGSAGFALKRWINFSGPLVDILVQRLGLIKSDVLRATNPRAMVELMKRARRIMDSRPREMNIQLSSLGYEVFHRISLDTPVRTSPPAVVASLKYFERRLDAHLTIEDLLRHVGCSRSVLYQSFREHFGSGPMEIFAQMRLDRAAILLRSTRHPANRIASMLGFYDAAHFSRKFKKRFGVSPGLYSQKFGESRGA